MKARYEDPDQRLQAKSAVNYMLWEKRMKRRDVANRAQINQTTTYEWDWVFEIEMRNTIRAALPLLPLLREIANADR